MENIVFIDDEIERMQSLVELCKDYGNVIFENSIFKFFLPDKAGKIVECVQSIKDVDLFFIHKSMNDERIPENIFNLIKNKVGLEKVFTFSGGSSNILDEKTLKRETLYEYFFPFIKFSNQYKEWWINCLYKPKEAERLFAKKLLFITEKYFFQNDNLECDAYFQLATLIGFPQDVYLKFESIRIFLIKLNDKIENL